MKRIVILGEKYSKNLGDGVICRCVEGLVKKYAYANDVVVSLDLSCRKNYNEKYAVTEGRFARIIEKITDRFLSFRVIQRSIKKRMGKDAYMYWTWERHDKKIVKALCMENPADCVIFAGGELFKDYFLWYIRYFVKEYGKRGSRICFNACGCDVNNSPFVTRSFQKILEGKFVHRVTMRSLLDSCASLIRPEQYCFMPDSAICAADFFQRSPKKKLPLVGLGIMAIDELAEKRERLLSFWVSIIKELEEEGRDFCLFCNGAEEDYEFAQEVASFAKIKREKLLPVPTTPEEMILQITSFDRICAFRMHSIIVAYAFQIPFVGFGWDKKIADFAKYIAAERQIVDWETTGAATIMERLHSCAFVPGRLEKLKSRIYAEFQTGGESS